MALIETNHLKKYFKTKSGLLHAVDDVTLKIEKNETLGVVGESGCGKSTLGRVILGLLPATEGDVTYDGESIWTEKGKKKALQSPGSWIQVFCCSRGTPDRRKICLPDTSF